MKKIKFSLFAVYIAEEAKEELKETTGEELSEENHNAIKNADCVQSIINILSDKLFFDDPFQFIIDSLIEY